MKTKFSILLIALLLQGCASKRVDMTQYESIDEFKKASKFCYSDSHCELVDVGYSMCGRYTSMVYSKLSISGRNISRLYHLASTEASYQKKRYETDIQFQEVCPAVMPIPVNASCRKKVCIKEYLRR